MAIASYSLQRHRCHCTSVRLLPMKMKRCSTSPSDDQITILFEIVLVCSVRGAAVQLSQREEVPNEEQRGMNSKDHRRRVRYGTGCFSLALQYVLDTGRPLWYGRCPDFDGWKMNSAWASSMRSAESGPLVRFENWKFVYHSCLADTTSCWPES